MSLTQHALLSDEYLDEVRRLIHGDPKANDGLVPVEDLQRRSQIRLAGEWHWVWAIDRDNARLLVEPADVENPPPAWWYQATAGERFAVAEPF